MICGNEVAENWRGKKKYCGSQVAENWRSEIFYQILCKYIDSYYVLVLICEYIVEPTQACSKERKLWKKKKIDVLTHCKKKEKKKKKKRNKDSLHDLPYETKKQDSCV